MGEIIYINGVYIHASPMVVWAYHEEHDWKKFNREKRKRICEAEKAKSL